MDSARILKGSLDLEKIPASQKDGAIQNFLELLDTFRRYKSEVYKEEGFDSHMYSYGDASLLFYLSWGEALKLKAFEGISQNVFQMIGNALMQRPGLGQEISDADWKALPPFKCDIGITGTPNCSDSRQWHHRRNAVYATQQPAYAWRDDDDDYLPNRQFSNKILEEEVRKHQQQQDYATVLEELACEPLLVRFHQGVMRHKGPALASYIEEIGSKVCEANFYRYEEELSRAEQKVCNAPRKIFSMLNREGKRQYISLDFAHGMFEYINPLGDHVGEYRLTGDKNSGAEPDHGFRSGYHRKL